MIYTQRNKLMAPHPTRFSRPRPAPNTPHAARYTCPLPLSSALSSANGLLLSMSL